MSAALTSRPLTEESDWDLVVAVKNGEDRAFEIVVNRYKARILSLAFRTTRNHEDAQDVTQQSFQNAFVHFTEVSGGIVFSYLVDADCEKRSAYASAEEPCFEGGLA